MAQPWGSVFFDASKKLLTVSKLTRLRLKTLSDSIVIFKSCETHCRCLQNLQIFEIEKTWICALTLKKHTPLLPSEFKRYTTKKGSRRTQKGLNSQLRHPEVSRRRLFPIHEATVKYKEIFVRKSYKARETFVRRFRKMNGSVPFLSIITAFAFSSW